MNETWKSRFVDEVGKGAHSSAVLLYLSLYLAFLDLDLWFR